MRAASTGGGHVRFVAIRLVVLAVLVMTAAGASSTSAAAAAAAAAASATATATSATVAAAVAASAARVSTNAAAPPSTAATSWPAARGPLDAANVTDCEPVLVSTRKPACTGQITEGPGPPRPSTSSSSSLPTPHPPSSRCPAPVTCADSSDNNNKNNINNNYNNNTSNHQCLEYARRELIPTMCPDDRSAYVQTGRLERYRLRHCCHHTVESVVQRPYTDRESCVDQVESALHMDDVAAAMSCQFDGVLARYDCKQNYSAKSCESCKDAYARWVCAAVLPHWTRTANWARTVDDGLPAADEDSDGRDDSRYRVKACRSVCLEVEQTCPWLLPVADDKNPYAGEAAFTCMDPDIGYQMSATDVTEDCCYEHCGGGLCVRNASACRRGDDRSAGQLPVCVQDVELQDDDSDEKCVDYSLTDASAAVRPSASGAAAALLLLLLLLMSALRVPTVRSASTAAVT